jgi:tRNA A-37 threonylcarbamoyl transferase component Bud32
MCSGPSQAVGEMVVGRSYRLSLARTTRNELWVHESPGQKALVKVYRGADAANRSNTECSLLYDWHDAGYDVPRIYKTVIEKCGGSMGPHIVMTWIDAPSLQDLLRDTTVPVEQRLQTVRRVLDVTSDRHAKAIAQGNLRLVRDDANTGNFLIDGQRVYHIDFERMPKSTDVLDAAAIELAKLLRWIVRDLGRDQLDPVLKIAADAYRDQPEILKRIISRTCDRPWQMIHRLLDRRRKAHPGAITKYDIADGLQRLI